MARNTARLKALADEAQAKYEAANPRAPCFSLAEFAGKPIPAREYLVRDLIPAKIVAGLYGDGASGKSLLAIMLGISTVLGRPFAGHLVDRTGPVVYLCGEDDKEEVHRRAAAICEAMACDLADLKDFVVMNLVDEDAILAIRKATPAFWMRHRAMRR